MTNSCSSYYKNQAGDGLPAFEGIQYQRGGGFFGNAAKFIYSNILKPIGRYLLPKAVSTGVNIGSDVLEGGDFSESVKKNLKRTAKDMLSDGYKRADEFIQTGQGKRKRRKSRSVKKMISSFGGSLMRRQSKRPVRKNNRNSKLDFNLNSFKKLFE